MNKDKNKNPKADIPQPDPDQSKEQEQNVFDSMYSEIDEKAEQGKTKRKRGRPSKKEKFEQEREKVEMTAVLVEPIVSFISVFLGSRLGEKWKMTKDETKEGAKVTTAVLNKYMPSFEDKAELVAFGMFWSGYILTRSQGKPKND